MKLQTEVAGVSYEFLSLRIEPTPESVHPRGEAYQGVVLYGYKLDWLCFHST